MKYYFTHETSLPTSLKNSNWERKPFEEYKLKRHEDFINNEVHTNGLIYIFDKFKKINKNSSMSQPKFTPTKVISSLLQLMDVDMNSQNNIVTSNIEIFYYLQLLKQSKYINFKDIFYSKNEDFMQNKFNKLDNLHVIGNPAYNNGKDKSFYVKFITNAYNLLQDGGTITIICPYAWIKHKHSMFKLMCENGYFEKIQQVSDKEAFGIGNGAPLCIFVYRLGGDKRGHADVERLNKPSEIEVNILNKLLPNDIKAKGGKGSTTGANPEFTHAKTDSHKYPVYLSSEPGDNKGTQQRREVFASSLKDARGFGVSKLICSHILAPGNVNHFCEFNKEKGVGRYAAYFECSELEADNIKLYFSSKVYHFINKFMRNEMSAGPAGVINAYFGKQGYAYLRIPKLDWTREWKDQDLYEHFNLTQEEIIFLENRIK